jgi:hypothetical protein
MSLTRPQRRQLSCWLIVALLFMQFAASAYACTRQTASASAVAAQVACAGHQIQGADASQTPTTPPLCKAHCEQGQQAVGVAAAADAPTVPLLLAVLNWHTAQPLPGPAADPQCGAPMGTPPPGSPPLYLALLSLRN